MLRAQDGGSARRSLWNDLSGRPMLAFGIVGGTSLAARLLRSRAMGPNAPFFARRVHHPTRLYAPNEPHRVPKASRYGRRRRTIVERPVDAAVLTRLNRRLAWLRGTSAKQFVPTICRRGVLADLGRARRGSPGTRSRCVDERLVDLGKVCSEGSTRGGQQ